MTVEIAAKNVAKKGIKGYMIEARDACTDEILEGTWKTPSGLFSQTEAEKAIMQCDDKALNTGKVAAVYTKNLYVSINPAHLFTYPPKKKAASSPIRVFSELKF